MLFVQANSESGQRTDEDKYVTEDFGSCTLGYGKDSDQYVQPYITCTSGDDTFALIGQKNGTWAVLLTPPDETKRTEEESRSNSTKIAIKVDEHASHEFSMLWAPDWHVVLDSLETSEVSPLLDELREGHSMTITRKDEEIVFDIEQASHAFADLFFKQSVALSKVESTESD